MESSCWLILPMVTSTANVAPAPSAIKAEGGDAVPAAMFLVKTPAETKAVMAGRVPSQVPATYGKRLTCVSPKR